MGHVDASSVREVQHVLAMYGEVLAAQDLIGQVSKIGCVGIRMNRGRRVEFLGHLVQKADSTEVDVHFGQPSEIADRQSFPLRVRFHCLLQPSENDYRATVQSGQAIIGVGDAGGRRAYRLLSRSDCATAGSGRLRATRLWSMIVPQGRGLGVAEGLLNRSAIGFPGPGVPR